MKRIVNLVQLLIVVAILYPVVYVWESDRVDNFCESIKPGLSKTKFLQLIDDNNLPVNGPTDISMEGGKWVAHIPVKTSFSGYNCEVRGAANAVAAAVIKREK